MEDKDDIQEEKVSEEEVKEEIVSEENESRNEIHEEEKDDLENTQEVVRPAEPVKKKKNGLKLIVVLLVIILLCVIGYMAYANLLTGKKETIKTDNKEYKSDLRLSGNGLENFDLYFLKLENKKANMVYSPLSIKYALEMLAEGAEGDSKAQLDNVIGDYKAKKYPNNQHMAFANAMFIRNSFKENIKEEYIKNLQDKYGAEIIYDDFASAANFNNWVNEKTLKLINELYKDSDVQDFNFILANALAIDMNWVNRIQAASAPLPEGMDQMFYSVNYIHEKFADTVYYIENDNYPALKFNGVDNIKSVEVAASFNHYDIIKDKGEDNIRKTVTEDYEKFLKENPEQVEVCPSVKEYVDQFIVDIGTNYKKADQSTDFYVSETDSERVFAKDLQQYDGVTLQYVGIMPKKGELSDFIENMTAEDISNIIKDMKEVKYDSFKEGVVTHIKGNIPLFKYDFELNLMKDLNELGIKDIFSIETANLKGMLKDGKKQFIGDASHKATIDFSNDGIKAAAVTAMGGMGAAHACSYDYEFEVPVEEIDVTFDKPYVYIIRDKDTGEVWFTGAVYEPTSK